MSTITKSTRIVRMRKVPKTGAIELPDLRLTTFKTGPDTRLLVVHVRDPKGEAPPAAALNELRDALSSDSVRATWVVTRGDVEIELTEEVAGV